MEVSGEGATVLETSSNMIGTTIDLKQIEDLPIGGRDLTQLSYLGARIQRYVERSALDRPGQQYRWRDRQPQPHEIRRQRRIRWYRPVWKISPR